MSEAIVAKRYAEALFQIAEEKNTHAKLVEELQIVRYFLEGNDKLVPFLTHPKVSYAKKAELIDTAFAEMQEDTLNTVKLLVQRHRTAEIPAIVSEFIQLVNEASGFTDATVYSVRALSDEELQQLEVSFGKRIGKTKVDLKNVVDPSILGGLKIRLGNTIYDGTVSGKLNKLSNAIKVN